MNNKQYFNVSEIIKNANTALEKKLLFLSDFAAPLSKGGPNDFYSNGDYWWPNPETSNGLPYIRRDGESNPGIFSAHRMIIRRTRNIVVNLAAGYKATGNEEYAKRAADILSGFFINSQTKMNPSLLYAQAIPGICDGRGIGIIDTLHLIEVPVAIEALKNSPYMTKQIYESLKAWFSEYLLWITTHPYGITEMNEKNNHSVCWYVQAAAYAKFTGNNDVLSLCKKNYKEILIPDQMALDGSFPAEIKRTKPYSYSIFVLENMVSLCQLLSDSSEDLWNYELLDGRGIKLALNFLYPYLENKEKWPFPKDVEHFEEWPVAMSFMLFSGIALSNAKYIVLWKKLKPFSSDIEVRRNISIRQPYIWL